MKPTRTQLVFAHFNQIWFLGVPSLMAIGVGVYCAGFLHPFSAWWDLIQFVFLVVLAFILGFFLAAFPGCILIKPFFDFRVWMNGGPFEIGDTVQILRGPHKGRISRVYGKGQGVSVRVESGPEEKKTFKDIFDPIELLRAGDFSQR